MEIWTQHIHEHKYSDGSIGELPFWENSNGVCVSYIKDVRRVSGESKQLFNSYFNYKKFSFKKSLAKGHGSKMCNLSDAIKYLSKRCLKRRNSFNENPVPVNYCFNEDESAENGFIYIFNTKNGVLKIGKTTDLASRLTSYQILYPYRVKFLKAVRVSDCSKAERLVHKKLDVWRVDGGGSELFDDICLQEAFKALDEVEIVYSVNNKQ